MERARFVEILREEGLSDDMIIMVWEMRATDDINELELREGARQTVEMFRLGKN